MEAHVESQTVQVIYDPKKTSPEALAQAITDGSDFEGSVLRR
jgi:hypothetical protein